MKTRMPLRISRAAVIALSMLSVAGCAGTMTKEGLQPRLPRVAIPQSAPVSMIVKPYRPVGNVIPVFVKPFAEERGQRLYDPSRITAIDSNGTRVAPMREQEAAAAAGGADQLYDSVTHPPTAWAVLGSAVLGASEGFETFGAIGPGELLKAGTLAFSADGRLRSVMLNERVISWSPSPVEEVFMAAEDHANGGMLPVLPRNATNSGCNCLNEPPIGGNLFFPLRDYVALEVSIANLADNRTEIVRVRWGGESDSSAEPYPPASRGAETE